MFIEGSFGHSLSFSCGYVTGREFLNLALLFCRVCNPAEGVEHTFLFPELYTLKCEWPCLTAKNLRHSALAHPTPSTLLSDPNPPFCVQCPARQMCWVRPRILHHAAFYSSGQLYSEGMNCAFNQASAGRGSWVLAWVPAQPHLCSSL